MLFLGSSNEVETKQKTEKHLNTPATSPLLRTRSFVMDAGPNQSTGTNRGVHQPGPGAATRVGVGCLNDNSDYK